MATALSIVCGCQVSARHAPTSSTLPPKACPLTLETKPDITVTADELFRRVFGSIPKGVTGLNGSIHESTNTSNVWSLQLSFHIDPDDLKDLMQSRSFKESTFPSSSSLPIGVRTFYAGDLDCRGSYSLYADIPTRFVTLEYWESTYPES